MPTSASNTASHNHCVRPGDPDDNPGLQFLNLEIHRIGLILSNITVTSTICDCYIREYYKPNDPEKK